MIVSNEYETVKRFWALLASELNFNNDRRRENIIIKHSFFTATRELTNLSLSQIGGLLGKDHATVLHATKNHDDNMRYLPNYKTRYIQTKLSLTEALEEAGYVNEVYCVSDVKVLRERLMKVSSKLRERIKEVNELQKILESVDIGVSRKHYDVVMNHNIELKERVRDLENKLTRYMNLV